ncbi:DUF1576 domain-containing protein [Aerococcaceae bacterium WGS1372]
METKVNRTKVRTRLGQYFFTEDSIKVSFLFLIAYIFMFFGIFVDPIEKVYQGFIKILQSPSNLITDYFEVGGIGAAFFNAGLLMLINAWAIGRFVPKITGPIVAAMFTVMGFAFFGKNLYNSIPITIGTLLYSKYRNMPISNFVLTSLFATTLAPVVSIITFGQGLPYYTSIPLGIVVGILIGFTIHPMGSSFLRFHQGYNLYNMGFTAGVLGMLIAGLMRAFKLTTTYEPQINAFSIVEVEFFFLCFSLFLLIIGFRLNGMSFKGYKQYKGDSGRLISDFITDYGVGLSFINMGVLGLAALTYIWLVDGVLEGAVIGGVLTVIGFGAFGKHIFNVMPVVIGIFLMQVGMAIDEPSSTASLLSALFGTTLAPIAGHYGWKAGILVGLLHAVLVPNTGITHAGLNLYNNGFAGGFVAATVVPILDGIRERNEMRERVSKNKNDHERNA